MERLTEDYNDSYCLKKCHPNNDCFCDGGGCPIDNCGEVIEALNKLGEYEKAEEQGLLVRLPCKVRDDVYIIPSPSVYGLNIVNGYERNNKVYHQHISSITFTDGHWYATTREEYGNYNEKVLNDIGFGMTWFLTREEAEKKLEKKNA